MTAISLKGIDEKLLRSLKSMARQRATSVDKVIVDVLKERIEAERGIKKKPYRKHHDLDHLFGTWKNDVETKELEEIFSSQRKIDKELWQ